MKKVMISILACALVMACNHPSGAPQNDPQDGYIYKEELIDPGADPPMIDSVELGVGRSDGVLRLYTTRDWRSSYNQGYEYSLSGAAWAAESYFTAPSSYCSSPVVADLAGEGANTLFLGGWYDVGILMIKYDGGWPAYSILPGSKSKGSILAMKAGDGRNDGVTRLYVAHMSSSGLVEYSWNSAASTYEALEILGENVGRFGIGPGRNDGINRIYVVERGGSDVHEFTWDDGADSFVDAVIFTGSSSEGSAHVADGRGDGVQRVYVWAGGLYELTWNSGAQQWDAVTIDANDNLQRFYIYAGSIRHDGKPCVYVSVKNQGLYEYEWADSESLYKVDAVTEATGGCVIGDGRGDGKERLYAARGTKGHYTDAAVVEIWEEPVQ